MVGGTFPIARFLEYFNRNQPVFQIRRRPDVIQAAAFVVSLPVRIAVAPPGIGFFRFWMKFAQYVDEVQRIFQPCQPFDFYRRMRNDFQHLSVIPNVVFQRRDVEIAADNHFSAGIRLLMLFPPFRHVVHKRQLMGKGKVGYRVGNIAAGRNIDIVDFNIVENSGANMPGIGFADPVFLFLTNMLYH